MFQPRILRAAPLLRAAALVLVGASGAATAEEASVVEEVVVTGSYIRGTPEDAALPVDVISAESLQEQGSPDIVALVQRIPSMSGGNIGESNRFLGNQAQGAATVNLRGLGLTRTLVLMNGQRLSKLTAAGGQEFVDVSQIPLAAIGRVEVLRDGAAVTYGSDAVAGVVNFITRRDLEGFEVGGSFTDIEDSDGDWDTSIAWGWNNDNGNVLFAADYAQASEIRLYDFDFMKPLPPGLGDGISLAGNPGNYFVLGNTVDVDGDGFFEQFEDLNENGVYDPPNPGAGFAGEPTTTQGAKFLDLGCTGLGAPLITNPLVAVDRCAYPYNWQEAPISDERRYHLFGEVNYEFSETLRFHLEGHYAYAKIPNSRVSVTLSSTQFPTPIETSGGSTGGGTSPYPAIGQERQSRFYIPPTNPGLQALMTDGGCPYAQALCDSALLNGVITSQTEWRPRALGGSPLFNGDTDSYKNTNTAYRISGGFDGDFSSGFAEGWGWTTRVTYAHNVGDTQTSDLSVNRVQLGLRGLGGEGCDPNTGVPGAGPCEWFNPFANSIEASIVNGASYTDATGRPLGPLNSPELWGWMRQVQNVEITAELFTAEAILTGDIGGFELPGGPVEWVVGTQWRWESRTVLPSVNADPYATPCVDSPPYGDGFPTCTVPGVGPLLFNGQTNPSDEDRDVPSAFAELKLPILENLELGIAGRYEDYSGEIGSTDDYRVSLRWEPLDWLVLRGSTGTTFRAPPQAAVTPGSGRIQAQFTNPTSFAQLYRPVDIFGNPDLEPETAETYNVGFVIATDEIELFGANIGRFDFSADYFDVTFEKEITNETGARVYGTMFPAESVPATNPQRWACANDTLRERFTFTTNLGTNDFDYNGDEPGGVYPECHPNNFLAVSTNLLNAREDTEISGLDLAFTWTYAGLYGGELSIGADGTWLEEWSRGDQYLLGTDIIYDPARDRSGYAELLSSFFSYSEWRANGHLNYNHGPHNVHFMAHYYQGVQDLNRQTPIGCSGSPTNPIGPCNGWANRGSHTTYDVTYQVELPWQTVLTATIANFTDEEPPYVRSQYNYDYMNYSPLGRTFKIGIRKQFGG
jgi:iron complex outermembrane receptor protein